jgi:hypothetical protein
VSAEILVDRLILAARSFQSALPLNDAKAELERLRNGRQALLDHIAQLEALARGAAA